MKCLALALLCVAANAADVSPALDTDDGLHYDAVTWTEKPPQAPEKRVYALAFGGWSKHLNGDAANEQHDLIGLQVEQLFIGHYRNSLGQESWAVGVYFFDRQINDDWSIHVAGGFVSGYENTEEAASQNTRPFIAPSLRYSVTEHFQLEAGVSPLVVGLGLRWEF